VIIIHNPRFDRQVEAAQRWLDEHGPPVEIADELEWLKDHLKRNPAMYAVAENARQPGLRRVYLGRIDYHVFYRYDERRQLIRFTAFRHAKRRPIRM
jgi:hypothetical protein